MFDGQHEANNEKRIIPPRNVLRQRALYQESRLPRYRGNPAIEALPPLLKKAETIELLEQYPEYDNSDRTYEPEERLHLVYTLLEVFVVFAEHWDLEQRISRMLRRGYVARNPISKAYFSGVADLMEEIAKGMIILVAQSPVAAALGFIILGVSGVGKSTALNAILSLYPQVIHHFEYKGQPFSLTQVVWIKLDCPIDGGIRGLCISFFVELDRLLGTNYYHNYTRNGRATKDEMLPNIARLVHLHCIGALVIDEIQVLAEVRHNSNEMLNFFVNLYNTVGVPTVLVGTVQAVSLFKKKFRIIRRGTGQGDFLWGRMQQDDIWDEFIASIWPYQYTFHETPLTDKLKEVLYDETQGITDFVVKLYMLAQGRAIATGHERVTAGLIRATARECFVLAQPILEALRRNDMKALETMDDVYIDADIYLTRYIRSVQVSGPSAKSQDTGATPSVEDSSAAPAAQALPSSNSGRATVKQRGRRAKVPSEMHSVVGSSESVDEALAKLAKQGYVRAGTEFSGEDMVGE